MTRLGWDQRLAVARLLAPSFPIHNSQFIIHDSPQSLSLTVAFHGITPYATSRHVNHKKFLVCWLGSVGELVVSFSMFVVGEGPQNKRHPVACIYPLGKGQKWQ